MKLEIQNNEIRTSWKNMRCASFGDENNVNNQNNINHRNNIYRNEWNKKIPDRFIRVGGMEAWNWNDT